MERERESGKGTGRKIVRERERERENGNGKAGTRTGTERDGNTIRDPKFFSKQLSSHNMADTLPAKNLFLLLS